MSNDVSFLDSSTAEFTLPQKYKTDRRGPIRWIASHTIHQWPVALVAVIGAFANAALMAVSPIIVGQALNVVLNGESGGIGKLGQLAVILAISQLVRGVFQFGRNFGFELVAQRIEREVRSELYTSLLGKSMTFHNLQPVGDTMARSTNDVRQVNYLFSPGLNMVIGSFNFLIMPLFLAPRYNWGLMLAPALFMVLYFLALKGYLGELAPITDEVRLAFGELNMRLSEVLDGIETVKGSSQEDAEVNRFKKNAGRYRDASVHQGNVEARFLPLLIYVFALAGGLAHALILFRAGLLNIGDVVAYFGLLLMLDFPTFTSLWAYSQISMGLAGGRRILELMNRENDLDQNLQGYTGQMRGEVEFKHATFRYESDEPALENFSFKVDPGMTVAVVGQTGSGKTTLARLINRTYDLTSGEILVDGINVRDWNLEALRLNISIIEQDIFLFSRSISENIAFGKPGATQEEIVLAAKAAQADEFIKTFSEGYATVIGERGVTLSGGQRQRLALARAFLTDPRILILDDSTSAIDSATEDMIQRAIYTAAKGRTTFIITHRLSQIRWADLILVTRNGRLTASGSHEELMQSSEAYRKIFSE
jgi:ATP-binding cassette, subfamily B, bacterial